MARVLIVEDDGARCEWFRDRLRAHELDVTCDPAEAVRWLAERQYELIMLDHDLLDTHYFSDERDDDRTGYAVAAWLAAHPASQPRAEIVIHSLNYGGSLRMRDLLVEAGFRAECIPFHHLQNRLRL